MGKNWSSLVFETCIEGVSSAVTPELLSDNQVAWGLNLSVRGGKPQTRPSFHFCLALPAGLIQGGSYFGVQGGMIVTQIAGLLYRLRIGETVFSYENIPLDFNNSGVLEQVWMQQTVESLVIQDGQSNPIVYNGSIAARANPAFQEVPRGRQMAYGNGRLWVAVNETEILAGDIRTQTPGSELIFSESQYLSGGGRIFFPEKITGMSFIPTTGTTDYGALLVFGSDYTESIRADISQRDLWASYPGFVTNVLRNIGCAGQWSISEVNQDLYWRDSAGGIRSLRSSLADESGPGNSPISREVSRLVDFDSPSLLPFCSSINFDNRLLMTSSPYLHINGAVAWKDMVSLDFAPVSTMRGKSFPSYNGTWQGLRIIQLVTGKFNNVQRAFAITSDDDGNNQLWEFDSTVRSTEGDIYTGCSDGTAASDENRIVSFIEYQRRDFGRPKERKRLERCDVWLSNIVGELGLTAYWRTDNNQQWNEWDVVETCATTKDDSTTSPHVWKNLLSQQRPQLKTFTIPDGTDPVTDYGKQTGYNFQIRLKWTGRCKIDRMMLHGTVLPDPDYANREESLTECVENNVVNNEITYTIPPNGCPEIELSVSDGSGGVDVIPNGGLVNLGVFGLDDARNFPFTIMNNGEGTLRLEDITISGDISSFEIVSQPDFIIPSGGSSLFILRYLAPGGSDSVLVSIPNNTTLNPYEFTVEAVSAPDPSALLVCSSETGTATLCGFSEYTDPSTPPKKYLTESPSGEYWHCRWPSAVDCGGNPQEVDRYVYSGSATYDPSGCTKTNNGVQSRYQNLVNYGNPCEDTSIPLLTSITAQSPFAPADVTTVPPVITTTKTTKEWAYTNVCTETSAGTWQKFSDTVSAELTEEDTEADAMARASITPGSSCTASIEPRGAGDFTFDFVAVGYDVNCSDLVFGLSYQVTVDLTEEDYGGGSPVVTQKIYDFVAAGPTDTIADVIVCPSGKQVTVSNPQIEIFI